jgi:predicted hydrolase (HD superfamily)
MLENEYINISNDRLNHMIGVARKMVSIGKEEYNFDEEECQELFVLGLLHDIGYEYSKEMSEHPKKGSDILKRLGYRDYKCVEYHGDSNSAYSSKYLDILNKADLSVDNKGNFVSFDERIEYIKNKYGKNSEEYRNAIEIVKK